MSAWVVVSVYGNEMEFIGVCFNFPLFFESVDVVDDSCMTRAQYFGLKAWEIIWVMSSAYAMLFVRAVGGGGEMSLV